jgi:hypothetical protein
MLDTGLLLLGPQLATREDGEDDLLMWTIMWRSRGAVVRDDIATRYGGQPRCTYHEACMKLYEEGVGMVME